MVPNPKEIAAEAWSEPVEVNLLPYLKAIAVLRRHKGFSYRRIAIWLTERGVGCDYNQVYRIFKKHHVSYTKL